MNILAICSALNNTYIAFKVNDNYFGEIIKSDENYHSLYLISKIKELSLKNNFDLSDLDFITVNCGPGSFTGIRVALTVAKVIAGELDLPCVPLNTAQILLDTYNADNLIMDARRDMFFVGGKNDIKLVLKDNLLKENFENKKILTDKNSEKYFKNAVCYEDLEENIALNMIKLALEIYSKANDKSEFNYLKTEANYIQTPPIF